ncbi:hypothetical protein [Actinacidiphila glaucinigra]|uniref:hypothetical protein n=1 Tax=Actinacidiphila glaucinigra TaxID=235986 RepID=UPI002E2FFE63|nr:hypothetical protein [Actinacidiphila glaucinigra]
MTRYVDEDLRCAHRRKGRLLNARRWIAAIWAGLCLAGIAATSALNAGMQTDKPESHTEEPVRTGTHVVDCEVLVDDIEQARADAERERQEEPLKGRATAKTVWVPQECADELEVPRSTG